ncbi:hypothetical protein LZC95_27250 [Pendulispora brunnea]|uniref:STAS/SEC14 domain-containing protein n=1 Tax=Pendulispora brunnea TaxID=2905690 RepID=A0ABZ2JXY5_9BACT
MEPGYQIDVDEEARILRVRGWGVWTVALASAYREDMIRAFARLRGKPWAILADRTGSTVQSEEVANIVADVMSRATAAGRVRAAVLVDSATTLLQWRRIAREQHVEQRAFHTEASALEWLAQEAKKDEKATP